MYFSAYWSEHLIEMEIFRRSKNLDFLQLLHYNENKDPDAMVFSLYMASS